MHAEGLKLLLIFHSNICDLNVYQHLHLSEYETPHFLQSRQYAKKQKSYPQFFVTQFNAFNSSFHCNNTSSFDCGSITDLQRLSVSASSLFLLEILSGKWRKSTSCENDTEAISAWVALWNLPVYIFMEQNRESQHLFLFELSFQRFGDLSM